MPLLPPLADDSDIEARWRPLTAMEAAIAVALLADASALLRAEYPDVDSRIASGDLDAGVVAGVVANMVKAALLQPEDGVSQESETVGPFSHSRQFSNPLGNLFLTAAQRVLIEGRRRPKALSVRFS